MENKQMVSSAIKELEKEKQEAEIQKIKNVVRSYLEKISEKESSLKVLQDDIRSLKKDLDDLKAGRLDKIEERQGKDKVHDKNTLMTIRRIEKTYIPLAPWKSEWEVLPVNTFSTSTSNIYDLVTQTTDNVTYTTGTVWQNFTGGVYEIGGHIINL